MRYIKKFSSMQAMSPTAKDVIELCGNEDTGLEEIAESIQTDPAITMKVIQIANSSAFARGEPVTSAIDAVRRLGIKQICQCVLNIEIMDNFSSMTKGGDQSPAILGALDRGCDRVRADRARHTRHAPGPGAHPGAAA